MLDADDPNPAGAPRPTPTPPAISASALSYDTSNPAVDLLLNQIHLVRHDREKLVCVSRGGLNGLNQPELQDGNVLGPYQGDYRWVEEQGVAEGNVLFRYINGVFVVIREEPWERFPGDQVVLKELALSPFYRADGSREELGGIDCAEMASGDRLTIETPGGGGWGEA